MIELTQNRFHAHKKELADISRENNVDIGVAIAMLAHKLGFQDWGQESMELKEYLAELDEESYVQYFAG